VWNALLKTQDDFGRNTNYNENSQKFSLSHLQKKAFSKGKKRKEERVWTENNKQLTQKRLDKPKKGGRKTKQSLHLVLTSTHNLIYYCCCC